MQNLNVAETCDKLTCCSKTVIFSTKLNQFVPNFNRVLPRHRGILLQLDMSISAIAMM